MLNILYCLPLFSRLYNKDAVIEYLLDKSAERPNMEVAVHIRGIKVRYYFHRIVTLLAFVK